MQAGGPARVLVSIYSGRKSTRLFGRKLVVFTGPGARSICIPVPLTAATFTTREPLRLVIVTKSGVVERTSTRLITDTR